MSARTFAGPAAVLAVLLAGLVLPAPAVAESGEPVGDLNSLVRANLRTDRQIVQAGRAVWVDFTLTNQTENRLTLRIPEMSAEPADMAEMGLPVEHIFSGRGFAGPRLDDARGERRDSRVAIRPKSDVPAIKLAPYGSVGVRVDITKYYPSLLRPGVYTLTWEPYNGSIRSEPLQVTVLAERQAVILTDFGKLTLRFYYEQAPNHVQNFIELVEQRFYDNLTFNRIIPGGLVQGGDNLGNRRGVRPDGKRLKAEFSNVSFELGTVGMARSSQDPDSASSQFFICLARQPNFDSQQTAFGYLVGQESFDTLRRLAVVPTGVQNGLADYPQKPVYIRAISLESVPVRERRDEAAPISPAPASRPSSTILEPRSGGASISASPAPGRAAGDLPGARAQGSLGRRPTTLPSR